MEPKNIYERGFDNQEEIDRLKTLDFPFFVSTNLLNENLQEKVVVDVGSGPNPKLGQWVTEQGGDYIAFDINLPFLANIKDAGLKAAVADARHLPLADNSIDIAHLRFVLMHFGPKDRSLILQEALRVAKEKVIILDYDWGDFEAEGDINEIRSIALELLGNVSDPFFGGKLKSEIEQYIGEMQNEKISLTNEDSFVRPRSAYLSEIKKMLTSLIMMARSIDPIKEEELLKLESKIENLHEDDDLAQFIPPAIKTIILNKQ